MIKRYLITTVALVSLVTSQAYCEPLITPKWSDYCRADKAKYCSSEYITPKYSEGLSWALMVSIIGIPFGAYIQAKIIDTDKNNYWVSRRKDFENNVYNCQQLSDNNKLIECYLTVKQIEEGKESDRRNYMIMSSMAAQQARQTQQLQGINRTLQGY